jgi:hypothetical protein
MPRKSVVNDLHIQHITAPYRQRIAALEAQLTVVREQNDNLAREAFNMQGAIRAAVAALSQVMET